jgi:carbonic anhydrase
MFNRTLLFTAALCITVAACSSSGDEATEQTKDAKWSYSGENGPDHWGDLSAEYALCKSGALQSPIDIPAATVASGVLADVAFSYAPSTGDIFDNGHTIRVDVQGGNKVTVAGKDYPLVQFHFHKHAEHTINGTSPGMELHLVHEAADGKAVALAVYLKTGAENAALAGVFQQMSTATAAPARLAANVDLSALIPADRRGWVYDGSLTTPPCSEGVRFHIYETPLEISAAQVDSFKYDPSSRPTQPLGARKLAGGS